jgi:RNA polymerase sigma-70 factor (ECF subfamily)
MESDSTNDRLSRISTSWSVLHQAQQGAPDAAAAAQQLLMQRYGGAIYRYLLAALRDPHGAEDLMQEFALALVRREFRKADPQRGRFRDYMKKVLNHLVSRHCKKQARGLPLPPDSPQLVHLVACGAEADRTFRENWREQLLTRAWEALAEAQPSFFAVLRFRADHPKIPSTQMAEQLARQLGKPLSAEGVRQTLHRARDKFADLLLQEVAQSLAAPTAEQVEEELCELKLLDYCRPALKRYAATHREA